VLKEGVLALQGLTPLALSRALPAVSLTDARRIVAQVHRDEPVATPASGITRLAREAAVAAGHVPTLEVLAERKSLLDPFVKYAMRTSDGETIEAVRIPLEHQGRFSVCVSSQIGCALACAFCATGRMGLRRNLEPWEIVEQVRIVRRRLPSNTRVHGVVFQGMGEPMANLDRVLDAIWVMNDPCALAIDSRAITVSTAGLPSGIRRLAKEAPKVRLALSIGTARVGGRAALMPIDRAHAFEEVLEAAVEHAKATGLAPMWAVTLLRDVNDGEEDALALAAAARSFAEKAGVRPRISVIPFNAIDGDPFERSTDDGEARFRNALAATGVFTHKRYSGVGDVDAACGQLAAKG
jgi:23S rRNA (adenine2503-C2)-methyltransferase